MRSITICSSTGCFSAEPLRVSARLRGTPHTSEPTNASSSLRTGAGTP